MVLAYFWIHGICIQDLYNWIISGKYNNTNTALGKRLEKNEEDIEGYFIKGNSKIP